MIAELGGSQCLPAVYGQSYLVLDLELGVFFL